MSHQNLQIYCFRSAVRLLLDLMWIPAFHIYGVALAWKRIIGLLGYREAVRSSCQIAMIRWRQPFRNLIQNGPGFCLILNVTFITAIYWLLLNDLSALRQTLTVVSAVVSIKFFKTASNKAFPFLVMIFCLMIYYVPSDLLIRAVAILSIFQLFCIAMASTIGSLLPPALLYLGVSSYPQFQTLKKIQRSLPNLVVTLLNQSEGSIRKQYPEHYNYMGLDPTGPRAESLRTRNGMWERTVSELIDMVPMVILDTREYSEPACKEGRWLLQRSRLPKATFVIENDGRAPLLEVLLGENHLLGKLEQNMVKERNIVDNVIRSIRALENSRFEIVHAE